MYGDIKNTLYKSRKTKKALNLYCCRLNFLIMALIEYNKKIQSHVIRFHIFTFPTQLFLNLHKSPTFRFGHKEKDEQTSHDCIETEQPEHGREPYYGDEGDEVLSLEEQDDGRDHIDSGNAGGPSWAVEQLRCHYGGDG